MEPIAARRSAPEIVAVEREHLEAIATIYAEVVRTSHATFDIEPPTIERWERTLAHTEADAGHFLIAAIDETGALLGYAKSGRFKERAAYASTCETSVYVAENARRRGVATALYARLLELLDDSPLLLATAGVAEPNSASTRLHRAFGFERVGTFTDVGVKFGRAWSVTWYQRRLAAGRSQAGGS